MSITRKDTSKIKKVLNEELQNRGDNIACYNKLFFLCCYLIVPELKRPNY